MPGFAQQAGGNLTDEQIASLVDLTLVSDQSLRSTIVAGRPDLGMPDWRSRLPGRRMSAREISDVAAWLASQRPTPGAAPSELYGEGAAKLR